MDFCPKCGHQNLNWDGDKKWNCTECYFTLYHNIASAVAVLIKCGGEIMFTRRNMDPKKGKLDLPGGFVDPRESAEETCARELKEELNLDLKISGLKYLASLPNLYEYKNITYRTLDLFFEYNVNQKFTGELELDEISETVWLKPSAIVADDLAFDSQKIFFERKLG